MFSSFSSWPPLMSLSFIKFIGESTPFSLSWSPSYFLFNVVPPWWISVSKYMTISTTIQLYISARDMYNISLILFSYVGSMLITHVIRELCVLLGEAFLMNNEKNGLCHLCVSSMSTNTLSVGCWPMVNFVVCNPLHCMVVCISSNTILWATTIAVILQCSIPPITLTSYLTVLL